MTDLEKKLNKIYNYADLIHTENILMLWCLWLSCSTYNLKSKFTPNLFTYIREN